MPQPSLRLAPRSNPDLRQRELDRLCGMAAPSMVSLTLRKLIPLLIDAVESDRAWLQDFADDVVKIDADLHEVLLAYGELGRRSAA